MSEKRVALGKDAIDNLKIAQSYIAEAYKILIESGLLPRNAKSICKNYINDSFEDENV